MYIVGVFERQTLPTMAMAQAFAKASLSSILVPRRKDEEKRYQVIEYDMPEKLGWRISKDFKKGDASWKKKPWVVDCQNSSSRGVHFTFDRFPTITKSHAAGLWIVFKNDFAKPVELLAGQGIFANRFACRD